MADTNLPTFAQGTMPSFTPPAEDRDSASSLLRETLGDQFSGIGNLMDRKAKADEKAMRLEQEQKQTELQRKSEAYGTYAEGIKSQYEQAKPALMAAPPKFNVTKDTQEGLTGLAALMTVGSLIIGSKGAASGVNAMNAMTGVLKGYQEGNQARIDFETKKYEQFVKDWERTLQQTKDALSRYEKMASLDLNKATAEAAAYAASQGQDVIAAKIRSGTIGDAIKMVKDLQQQTTESKLMSVVDKETGQQTYATETQIRQNPDRYQAAPTGRPATEKPLMPSAAERKNYVGLNQLASTAEELVEKLKDPAFAAKVDKYRLSAFLSEEGGKIASQVLREKIPDDVQDFINKATRLRNQYYLEISGKAVTGGEAMRNYNVVPQPGMNATRLRQTLESLRDGARGDVDEFKKMYPRLPDLTKGGTVVRTAPEQQTPAQQRTYAVGEVIESGGKKYRALTAGPDPDVEEIQ